MDAGRWLRVAAALLLGFLILGMSGWGSARTEVVAEIRTQAGADGELFFAGRNQEHAPDRRIAFVLVPDGQWHTYRVALPVSGGVERIRLDPGSLDGPVEIRSVAVETRGNTVHLAGDALREARIGSHMLSPDGDQDASLRFIASAPDPYIDFRFPDGTGVVSAWARFSPWLLAAITLAVAWLALVEPALVLGRRLVPRLAWPGLLRRLAGHVSDPALLVVPPRAMAVVLATACCAIVYVALNLHQSSIGIWEHLFAETPIEQTIDIGSPRAIRSDEWNAQTPWVLSQVARGKALSNASVGGEDAPLLASVPLKHSSAIAQAKFYGFHLFDADTGFSWWWAYKSFALFLSFFWLFLLLTRGDVAASVLGSAWIYGSSFTQWWFSSNLPELLTAFALSTIGGIYLLFAARRAMIALGALLIAYGVLNLLLHLYPPFIVPLAFLGAAILVGISLEPGKMRLVGFRFAWRAAFLCGAAVITGIIGGLYLVDATPSIQVMTNTVYPGHRISDSGGMSLERMLYGFFETLRVGDGRLPLPPTNGSEASNFVLLFPLLLALPVVAFFRRANGVLTCLALYLIVVSAWICIQLPGPFEKLMQLSGWAWAPPIRALLGLGIGSIIVITVMFARVRNVQVETRDPVMKGFVPVITFFAVAALGWSLREVDPAFFRHAIVLGASTAAALVAVGVVFGRTGFLATGLALFLLPSMTVNPLLSGLSSLDEKPLLVAARDQSARDVDRWAVVGTFVLSQGLKSQGLDVVTGSQMIPDLGMAKVLDPAGRYADVWNRYAHVVFRSEPGRGLPEYRLLSPDLYEIGIDVCGDELRELGITRIAYAEGVPPPDARCLEELHAPADSGVRLFRLTRDPGSSDLNNLPP